MVRGNGETDFDACLESPIRSEHHKPRGLEWVLSWEKDPAMIDPTL